VEIDQKRIDAILQRVRTAKLPRQMPPTSAGKPAWETGADIQYLEGLRQYWTTKFNWRAAEARLNRYPQYKARVDGVDIHFYYVKGEGSNPLPLLLTHGWPGSVVEFLDVIGRLTQPSKHGGRAEDAFTVIIPSLPGYAFSSLPGDMNIWNTTTRLWHKLVTEVIGHKQYVAQGGDVGLGDHGAPCAQLPAQREGYSPESPALGQYPGRAANARREGVGDDWRCLHGGRV
jgi:hypothetical protein